MRYFFDTVDGVRERDSVGTELKDHHAARMNAIKLTGRILASQPDYLIQGQNFHMEVASPEGELLFTIVTYAINSSASGIPNL